MPIATFQVSVVTPAAVSAVDVTEALQLEVSRAGIQDGLCVVSVDSGSCALSLVEGDVTDVVDVERVASEHLPISTQSHARDQHEDISQMPEPAVGISYCLTLPFEFGELLPGSWNSVVLLEGNGPADRRLDITLIGG